MKNILTSFVFLFVFAFAGMTGLYGAFQDPHNPHNPANPHNPIRQAHEQHIRQHMLDHQNGMHLHRQAHEQAFRDAKGFHRTDSTSIHQLHQFRPERRNSNLLERIRTWRENRPGKV